MDQILLGLGAAGAALFMIAVAVALWEHRRHKAEVHQQLVWSENTRDLLQTHATDLNTRLATPAEAVGRQSAAAAAPATLTRAGGTAVADHTAEADLAHPAPTDLARAPFGGASPQTASETAHRTAHAGSAALAMAAAQSSSMQHWIDTEPMVLTSSQLPDFDPTMPMELSTQEVS